MSTAIVTGSGGLVGSETVRFLHDQGMDVIGIDNNLREYFFGPGGSTRWQSAELAKSLSRQRHFDLDIRDQESILSDVSKFMRHYPSWKYTSSPDDILDQIIETATFRAGRARA